MGGGKLTTYLQKHLPLDKLKACLPLSLEPSDLMLVHRALDPQKEGPSPGLDGVSAKVYRTFESFFVPLMHHTHSYLLGGGLLDQTWSKGVQTNIPKGSFNDSITELRPLTIVNVMLKWISTIFLLQLEDICLQVVPTQQAGFMKGRDMYQNLHHCRSFGEAMPQGFVLAVDFENAYNTIAFEHAHVMFKMMRLPTGMIALIMQLLQSPVSFCNKGIVVLDVVWTPEQ